MQIIINFHKMNDNFLAYLSTILHFNYMRFIELLSPKLSVEMEVDFFSNICVHFYLLILSGPFYPSFFSFWFGVNANWKIEMNPVGTLSLLNHHHRHHHEHRSVWDGEKTRVIHQIKHSTWIFLLRCLQFNRNRYGGIRFAQIGVNALILDRNVFANLRCHWIERSNDAKIRDDKKIMMKIKSKINWYEEYLMIQKYDENLLQTQVKINEAHRCALNTLGSEHTWWSMCGDK